MKQAAAQLRQSYGAFEARPGVEYGGRSYPSSIESRGGTVLFRATANATDEDTVHIVAILNRVLELAATPDVQPNEESDGDFDG